MSYIYDVAFSLNDDTCILCGFPCDYPDLCPYNLRITMYHIALSMIADGLY